MSTETSRVLGNPGRISSYGTGCFSRSVARHLLNTGGLSIYTFFTNWPLGIHFRPEIKHKLAAKGIQTLNLELGKGFTDNDVELLSSLVEEAVGHVATHGLAGQKKLNYTITADLRNKEVTITFARLTILALSPEPVDMAA